MPTTTLPNQHIFSCAIQYDDAANHLDAILCLTGAHIELPMINARAIAIELFLKSLWVQNEHIPTGSSPEKLTHLSSPTKETGKGPGHNLQKNFNKLSDPWKTLLLSKKPALREDLSNLTRLFAARRYVYEMEKMDRQWKLGHLDNLDLQKEIAAFFRIEIKNLTPIEV